MASKAQLESTAFERAFQDLFETTKSQPKKHLSKFLLKCQKASEEVSLLNTCELIDQAENASSERKSRRLTRKTLEPVVESLKAYDKVISVLCRADPMPTAIIWGALKVVVDCTDRIASLFTIIKTQLSALRDRIEDIQEYESLFGRSPELQRALFVFYKDVIRFWSRVDKECSRPAFLGVVQAAMPLNMTKIRDIINTIEIDVDRIHVKVQNIDLRESKEERNLSVQARQAQQDAEMNLLHSQLQDWLEPSTYQHSFDIHRYHVTQRTMAGTLGWLRDDASIQDWLSGKPENPSLWVTAAPGFGKTIACSSVIENLKQNRPETTVCYHFYQQSKLHPAKEILRGFASQLYESVRDMLPEIISDVQKAVRNHKDIVENIINLIELTLNKTKVAFFFIDGVDEAISSRDTKVVVTALNALCVKFNGKVRFWCSSQNTVLVKEMMDAAKVINLDGRNMEDVREYLHQALQHKYQAEEVDEEDQIEDTYGVASHLGEKAHGSFMWASLMRHDIEEAKTPAELSSIMESDVPDGLDQYFTDILHRIDKSKWPLASLLLSLVCYARRPLSISELREAVAILRSKDLSCIDRTERPFPGEMKKILLPLVYLNDTNPSRKVYKACHSTFTNFVHQNPGVFCNSSTESDDKAISGLLLGEACLRYLRQDKFSKLLVARDGSWYAQDENGKDSTVATNPFTIYAAKYWSVHLNAHYYTDESPIYMQTSDFVCSPNFWTCLQIQNLYVEGQFCTYRSVASLTGFTSFRKRFLPHWYIHRPGNTVFSRFRTFLNEWGYLLDWCCSKTGCPGEIDRCLVSGLGSTSFLAGVEQRYRNSTLTFENDTSTCGSQFENCSASGGLLSLVNLRPGHGNSQFEIQVSHINIQSGLPASSISPTLHMNIASDEIDWLPYTCFRHVQDRSCVCIGKPRVAGVSSCGKVIRIANKVWRLDEKGTPVPLKFENDSLSQLSVEHIECKNDLIFVTSRQKTTIDRRAGCAIRSAAKQKTTNILESHQNLAASLYKKFSSSGRWVSPDSIVDPVMTDRKCSLRPLEEDSILIPESTKQTDDNDADTSEYSTESDGDSSVVHEFEAEQYWSEASTSLDEHHLFRENASTCCAADRIEERISTTMEPSDSEAEDDSDSDSEPEDSSDSETGDSSRPNEKAGKDSEMFVETSTDESVAGDDDDDDESLLDHRYLENLLEDCVVNGYYNDSSEDFGAISSDEDDHGKSAAWYMDYAEEISKTVEGQSYSSDEESGDEKKKPNRLIVSKKLFAVLKVYRDDGNTLKPVFKFSWPNARLVCNSPPAIHPSRPLVVWPVTDSVLLFADYSENTWFKKKLRLPKGHRFVTIRCHFSACGSYLHIAALKRSAIDLFPDTGQQRQKKEGEEEEESQENETDEDQTNTKNQSPFSLIVLTYILSSRKTTYSPPRLVYRQALSLPMMRFPRLTFVWTKDELITSHSGLNLHVFRIHLFHNPQRREVAGFSGKQMLKDVGNKLLPSPQSAVPTNLNHDDAQVMVPCQTIFLPRSARHRPVYFIPSTVTAAAEGVSQRDHRQGPGHEGNTTKMATLFIGPERSPLAINLTSDLQNQLQLLGVDDKTINEDNGLGDDDDNFHLPGDDHREQDIIGISGCAHTISVLLDEQKDLGGWRVPDFTKTLPEGQGIGTLDELMELFDPKDDCDDIEPWIFDF